MKKETDRTEEVLNKKTKDQIEYENDTFIQELKKKVKDASGKYRSIKLPGYMNFYLDEENKTVNLKIFQSERVKKSGLHYFDNPVSNNMQTDNAAFEGWAICLKAWLPEKIQYVQLDWDEPTDEKINKHYNRYLYRVYKFGLAYPWFSIVDTKKTLIENFAKGLTGLHNNCGSKDPDEKEKEGENKVEYRMVNTYGKEMCNVFSLDIIDHQLPIGVRKDKNTFFTGQASAIDLWGTKEDCLSIFELKFSENKSNNTKVGIISELFLYTSIMADIISGTIMPPSNCPRLNESKLYSRIHEMKKIKSYMLADKYHPLIENDTVLSLLNEVVRNDEVSIEFIRKLYSFSFSTNTLTWE